MNPREIADASSQLLQPLVPGQDDRKLRDEFARVLLLHLDHDWTEFVRVAERAVVKAFKAGAASAAANIDQLYVVQLTYLVEVVLHEMGLPSLRASHLNAAPIEVPVAEAAASMAPKKAVLLDPGQATRFIEQSLPALTQVRRSVGDAWRVTRVLPDPSFRGKAEVVDVAHNKVGFRVRFRADIAPGRRASLAERLAQKHLEAAWPLPKVPPGFDALRTRYHNISGALQEAVNLLEGALDLRIRALAHEDRQALSRSYDMLREAEGLLRPHHELAGMADALRRKLLGLVGDDRGALADLGGQGR